MSNDDYAKLPGTNVEVRDVTSDLSATIANLLISDPVVSKLNFPRLRFPRLGGLGYSGNDFIAIAKKIAPNEIEIYETKTDQSFNAKFCSYGKLNFYVFTPNITIAPSLSVRTIVHETAHAIQDWKEWRESSLDREVDAHFAEALYLVLSGKEKEAQNDLGMAYYIIAAQEYKDNPKYLASLGFRKMRQKLKQETFQHYQFMNSLITSNFDAEEFNKSFNKKKKMDGIP